MIRPSATPVRLIWLLIVLIYVGLVVFSSWSGPSLQQDDHWYLNDLRTFIQTGRMQTNQIFPAMIANGSYAPPVVLHNLPLMYLVLPFAILFGVYWGWIAANIVFTLLSCLILIRMAKRFQAGVWQQLAMGAMYLFWPVTVHLSAHPLAEAGIVFFLLLMGYCWLFTPPGYPRQLLLGFLAAILVLNRPSYLLLALLLAILTLSRREGKLLLRISYAAVFLLTVMLVKTIGNMLMPQIDLSIFAAMKLPFGQTMQHFYAMHPLPFSLPGFLHKQLHTLQLQLTGRNLSHTVFVLLFDLLLLWFLFPGRRAPQRKELSLFVGMNALVYAATLISFQYQTRFLQMLLPLLLLWFILFLSPTGRIRKYRMALLIFCLISLSGSFYSSIQNRNDALLARQVEQSCRQIEKTYHPQGAMLVDGKCRLMPYVFTKNSALLMFDDDVNTRSELLWMRNKVPYQWLVCQTTSTALDSLSTLRPRFVTTFPHPMSEWGLYQLK
jgi:hypothetical protein